MRVHVDLRSDTVTRPTPAMRAAMAEAEVGDDVLDGDPTTRRLEERVAELLGKEAALFFPSGTMANQTALATLGRWGGEAVVEAGAHVFHYEEGAAAALSGVQLHPVPTDDGVLTPLPLHGAGRELGEHRVVDHGRHAVLVVHRVMGTRALQQLGQGRTERVGQAIPHLQRWRPHRRPQDGVGRDDVGGIARADHAEHDTDHFRTTDALGHPPTQALRHVLAANPTLHPHLLDLIGPLVPPHVRGNGGE